MNAEKDSEQVEVQEKSKKCPKCGEDAISRIRRKWWMRLIPGSVYFRCEDCRHQFMMFWKGM